MGVCVSILCLCDGNPYIGYIGLDPAKGEMSYSPKGPTYTHNPDNKLSNGHLNHRFAVELCHSLSPSIRSTAEQS